MTALRRRLASALLWIFLAQSVLRLAMLTPVHHMGRLSPVIHGATMVLFAGLVAAALLLAKGRKPIQLVLSIVLAACWVLLTTYDAMAFAASRVSNRPFQFDEIAKYYCEGKNWIVCLPYFPEVLLPVLGIATALSILLFAVCDDLTSQVTAGMRKARCLQEFAMPRGKWRSSLDNRAYYLAVPGVLATFYIAAWAMAPTFMAAREPIVYLLQTTEFLEGPKELVNFPRPEFRVRPDAGIRPRTLVLITVDSLRADYVGLKPGDRNFTPFLRSLAQAGNLQDVGPAAAICPSSYCGIAGLLSSGTWATLQRGPPLTLADVLHANGYENHFLLSGPHRKYANLGKLYGPTLTTFLDDTSPDSSMLGDDREQVRRLHDLKVRDPERTFIWIHLMSAHAGGWRFHYKSGLPNQETIGEMTWGPDYVRYYGNGVRQADHIIGMLFAELKSKRLLENTLVVISADHGDRVIIPPGMEPHGGDHDKDTIEIPLLVYESSPSVWPTHAIASQADIAPTILDRVGISIPQGWAGSGLGRPPDRRAVAVDGFDMTGFVGLIDGRRVLARCNIATGATTVEALDGAPLSPAQTGNARQAAPMLYNGLARRNDASQCFGRR